MIEQMDAQEILHCPVKATLVQPAWQISSTLCRLSNFLLMPRMLGRLPVKRNAHLFAWEAAPALHIPMTKVAAQFVTIRSSMYGNKVTVFFTFASLQKNCKVVKPIKGG
jgi:hypothetical protein